MDQISSILSGLGATWPGFFAQVILFLIVYLILNKFAFGPIMEILEERKKRIAAGEEKLAEINKQAAEMESRSQERVNEANQQAERLVTEARESADALADKKRDEASREASQIIAKAREASAAEKTQLLADLKKEFGRMVVDATGKVTGKVLTDTDKKRLNDEAAAQLR